MDTLRNYLNSLDPGAQGDFASRCNTTIGYLRKAISTGQQLGEMLAVSIERESGGAVSVAAIRPDLAQNLEASGYRRCAGQEPPPPSRPRPLPTLNGQGATPTAEPATTAARAQTAACGVSAGSEHTEQEAASCRG